MANVTRNLSLSKSAYIKAAHPSTVYTTSSGTSYLVSKDNYSNQNALLLGFANWPSSLKRNRLISARLRLQVGTGQGYLAVYGISRDFDASTMTWKKRPTDLHDYWDSYRGHSIDESQTWGDVWINSDAYSAGTAAAKSSDAYDILNSGGVYIYDLSYYPSDYYGTSNCWFAYTSLAASGNAYIEVTYSDSVMVESQVTRNSGPSSGCRPDQSQKFSWYYARSGSYHCANETWTQASAVFQYKKSSASSWTSVNISGSTTNYTLPANTLEENTSYDWRVQGTDTDGTTTTSSTGSFTTDYTVTTPTTFPSGTVNPFQALSFAWTVTWHSSGANEAGTTGVLYWKTSSAGSWNTIAASGNNKNLTVPSGTFPVGSTIQWYIRVTSALGYVSTSATKTFTTPTSTITADSYPSGSNFDTRQAVTFTYHFATAAGNYPQSSAKLYWKKSTASSWNQISASGSTTSITVPANTFPTNSTIDWYLQGTDAGGTTTSTSTLQFKTVSTTVQVTQAPSGSNIYTGSAITFKWKYNSAVGDYTQSSATIYWKKDTENNYRSIPVSGNVQEKAVAANTFPTNSTIQWYLAGTDSGGTTTQTNVASFKTLTSKITVQNSPVSGYSDPRYAIKFQWYFSTSGGSVPQGSATFYWKKSTDENYTAVAASGGTTSVTIPANTFPVASTIEWYVSGTDVGGTTSTSQVYSFSTAAGTAYAYCQSPIGTAEDGSAPITLRWILTNSDGSSPSLVTLSWKTPTDVDWTVIRQSSTPFTSWTVDAAFFPVGEIEWKVVATNRDEVDGPAGTAAFICLRAPDPPEGLRATAAPFSTISWQASGQEAYEISIDGTVVQKDFGPGVNSWTVTEPLSDGIHTITVRIQGSYGFWSEPAETTIDVLNVPTGTLTLTAAFEVDAVLTVSPAPDADGIVWWYRDGKAFARTIGSDTVKDRVTLGRHEYFAEIRDQDGFYTRSEPIAGSLKSCVTRIAPFAGGDWLELKLSENSNSVQDFRYTRTVNRRHVLGTKLPVLELSEFEDGSGSYDCAFRDVESAAAFEALRGQVVILKSRGSNVVIGALSEIQKKNTDFYITYSFTVQRTAWEDFIDGGND